MYTSTLCSSFIKIVYRLYIYMIKQLIGLLGVKQLSTLAVMHLSLNSDPPLQVGLFSYYDASTMSSSSVLAIIILFTCTSTASMRQPITLLDDREYGGPTHCSRCTNSTHLVFIDPSVSINIFIKIIICSIFSFSLSPCCTDYTYILVLWRFFFFTVALVSGDCVTKRFTFVSMVD